MNFSTSGMRNKAYLIIIAAFVIGVVTGGLLLNLFTGHSSANKRPLTAIEELTDVLELDVKQRQQIEDVFDSSRQQSKELMKTVQPQLDELKKQTKMHVQAILQPHQQEKYKEWNQKRDAQRAQREKQGKK